MDWDAEFADAYGFEDDMSNILVFDSKGNLLHRFAGTELDNKEIQGIVDIIKSNY